MDPDNLGNRFNVMTKKNNRALISWVRPCKHMRVNKGGGGFHLTEAGCRFCDVEPSTCAGARMACIADRFSAKQGCREKPNLMLQVWLQLLGGGGATSHSVQEDIEKLAGEGFSEVAWGLRRLQAINPEEDQR